MSIDRWMDKEAVVYIYNGIFSSVQLLSHVQLFATPWTVARQASLSITNTWGPPKPMSIKSDAIQPYYPLSSPSPPALNLSQHQGLFPSALHIRWPEYWSFSFNISPSTQDWSPLGWTGWISLQSKGLSSSPTPQFKSINSLVPNFLYSLTLTSIHNHSKTIALTRQTFVGKVMSLLFNMLSRLVITFLPRSKHLLISWLQSPSAEILESRKIKSVTVSTVSPSICHEVMELDATIIAFWMLSVKPTFYSPLSLSSRGSSVWSLVPLPFLKPDWTSGSSRFTYCWSLAWRILSMTLLVCEMSAIVWLFEHFLALPFFGIAMKTDLFQSCGHCWVFQICWHIECSPFTVSSFRICNSSTGIPSPPLVFRNDAS